MSILKQNRKRKSQRDVAEEENRVDAMEGDAREVLSTRKTGYTRNF